MRLLLGLFRYRSTGEWVLIILWHYIHLFPIDKFISTEYVGGYFYVKRKAAAWFDFNIKFNRDKKLLFRNRNKRKMVVVWTSRPNKKNNKRKWMRRPNILICPYRYWKNSGHMKILSPQQIVSCDSEDGGCNGGDTITAYLQTVHSRTLIQKPNSKRSTKIYSRKQPKTTRTIDRFRVVPVGETTLGRGFGVPRFYRVSFVKAVLRHFLGSFVEAVSTPLR